MRDGTGILGPSVRRYRRRRQSARNERRWPPGCIRQMWSEHPEREGRQGISERQAGLTAQADSPRSRKRKNLGKPGQKRLLAGVREGAMEGSSTGHAADAKYVGQMSLCADIRVSFIPVHLRFSTPNVGLRNERLLADQSQLNLALRTNRRIDDSATLTSGSSPRMRHQI